MSVKNAIKLLDWWITKGEEQIKKLETDYKFNSEIQKILFDNEKTVIKNLILIKKELVPNCKHPKNMQDTCDGVKYCMSCNLDL